MRIKLAILLALATMAVALTTLMVDSATAKTPATATVLIRSSAQNHSIPDALFGSNLQWENQGDGLLQGKAKGETFPGDVLNATKAARVSSIRFPGGALANTYRWKNGIGPRKKRATGRSFAGLQTASNFGSDELILLTRTLDIPPVITVNLSAGAEEAADWVEYLNGEKSSRWGAQRTINVGPEPTNTIYWEIGNEIYSPNEHGHLTAPAYAEKVKQFIAAMKQRDPQIKVGIALEASFLQAAWMKDVLPDLLTWNEEVLKRVGRDVDFLSLHFYAPFDKKVSATSMNQLVWAGPIVFEGNLKRIRELAQRYCRPNIEYAVTEYSTFFGEKLILDERISGTENTLFNTLLMLNFMRSPDITLANHWSLLNNNVFGMLKWNEGKLTLRPWYNIFTRLRNFAGSKVLATEIKSPTYRVDAKGNVPNLEKINVVEALVVRDDNKWRLVLINRSPDQEIEVSLSGADEALPAHLDAVLFKSDNEQRVWLPPATQSLSIDPDTQQHRVKIPPASVTFLES